MSRVPLTLRWVAALFVALIVHVAVLGLGGVMWQRWGGDVVAALGWIVFIGTIASVLAGTLVLPRERWRIGARVIWGLAVAFYFLSFLTSHFSLAALYIFGSAVTGGMMAAFLLGAFSPSAKPHSRSTIGRRPWLTKAGARFSFYWGARPLSLAFSNCISLGDITLSMAALITIGYPTAHIQFNFGGWFSSVYLF